MTQGLYQTPIQQMPFGSPSAMPMSGGQMIPPMGMDPFSPPPQSPPVEIRGVGIKFGERLDATGRIMVYVKRILQNGPAHHTGGIGLGDVLVRVDGDDISACGLDILRSRIPGPANTWVRLGFSGAGGRIYEVPLCRSAYGSGEAAYRQQVTWRFLFRFCAKLGRCNPFDSVLLKQL